VSDTIIIGAGVSGLTCGIRLIEAGLSATIWARDLPLRTTSNVAAAVWYPYKAYPEHLVVGWAGATYAELLRLAEQPGTGVIVREGLEIFPSAVDEPWWREAVPSYRRITPAELPAGYQDGYVFAAPVAEMTIYLQYLQRRFDSLGGRIDVRAAASFDEAFAVTDRVIDCAGLGARELAGDSSMIPIRGQVVRVEQVGLDRFILDDYNPGGVTYIVPRINDCILGGTADEGAEDLAPDAATAEAILARCIALEPRLRGAAVLEHKVGLRPGRPTVRLEAASPAPGRLLVHNYGHGGAGVTLSWGCAAEVVRLVHANA
jgi:D-amino-acid oxidase